MINFVVSRQDDPLLSVQKFFIRLATPVKYCHFDEETADISWMSGGDTKSSMPITAPTFQLRTVDASVVLAVPDELFVQVQPSEVIYYISKKYYDTLRERYPKDISKKIADALSAFLTDGYDFSSASVDMMTPYEKKAKSLVKMIPGMRGENVACPQDGCSSNYGIMDAVMHLNDRHKWKREDIADWLDTLDADLRLQPAGTAPVKYEGPFASPKNAGKEKE